MLPTLVNGLKGLAAAPSGNVDAPSEDGGKPARRSAAK
jgi:hypothetical protein